MKVILWDFDGTLALRPGMWSSCLIETLDEYAPGHSVTHDRLQPFLRDTFPWHRPEVPHPDLCRPGAWWKHVEGILAAAYEGVGVDSERAAFLARLARDRYIDPSIGWTLYQDTQPALESLQVEGYTNVILSNHVPELQHLVDGLGIGSLVDLVITSAATGYEKPNAAAFQRALQSCGQPHQVWMVGDNPLADIAGAEAAGIPAVLVRTAKGNVKRRASDLYEAASVILRQPNPSSGGRHALDGRHSV